METCIKELVIGKKAGKKDRKIDKVDCLSTIRM